MLSYHCTEGLGGAMHCNVLPRFGPQGARFIMALTSCAPIDAVTQVEKKTSLFAIKQQAKQ